MEWKIYSDGSSPILYLSDEALDLTRIVTTNLDCKYKKEREYCKMFWVTV